MTLTAELVFNTTALGSDPSGTLYSITSLAGWSVGDCCVVVTESQGTDNAISFTVSPVGGHATLEGLSQDANWTPNSTTDRDYHSDDSYAGGFFVEAWSVRLDAISGSTAIAIAVDWGTGAGSGSRRIQIYRMKPATGKTIPPRSLRVAAVAGATGGGTGAQTITYTLLAPGGGAASIDTTRDVALLWTSKSGAQATGPTVDVDGSGSADETIISTGTGDHDTHTSNSSGNLGGLWPFATGGSPYPGPTTTKASYPSNPGSTKASMVVVYYLSTAPTTVVGSATNEHDIAGAGLVGGNIIGHAVSEHDSAAHGLPSGGVVGGTRANEIDEARGFGFLTTSGEVHLTPPALTWFEATRLVCTFAKANSGDAGDARISLRTGSTTIATGSWTALTTTLTAVETSLVGVTIPTPSDLRLHWEIRRIDGNSNTVTPKVAETAGLYVVYYATESDHPSGGVVSNPRIGSAATEHDSAAQGTASNARIGHAVTEQDIAHTPIRGHTATETDLAHSSSFTRGNAVTEHDNAALGLRRGAIGRELDAAVTGGIAPGAVLGSTVYEIDEANSFRTFVDTVIHVGRQTDGWRIG